MLDFLMKNLDQVLAIVAMILTWLLARPWAKTKLAEGQALLVKTNTEQVWKIVVGVVAQLYVETVRDLKAAGTFTPEMKKRIATRALELIKAEIAEHGLSIAQSVLPGMIEIAVSWLKSKGANVPAPFSAVSSAVSASVPPPELGVSIPGLP
jgi:hypothetical protein